ADVLVIGGVDLLLGHQERSVFLRHKQGRGREIEDVARLQPVILRLAGLSADVLGAHRNPCHVRSIPDQGPSTRRTGTPAGQTSATEHAGRSYRDRGMAKEEFNLKKEIRGLMLVQFPGGAR